MNLEKLQLEKAQLQADILIKRKRLEEIQAEIQELTLGTRENVSRVAIITPAPLPTMREPEPTPFDFLDGLDEYYGESQISREIREKLQKI